MTWERAACTLSGRPPLTGALAVATVLTVAIGVAAEPLLDLAGNATVLAGGS